MFLTPFHQANNNLITITPEQGSAFAKEVSDDFNPLHNPDSKRFCVPGDLLFALVLNRFGLSKKMVFNYTGMIGKGVELIFPETADSTFNIVDNNDKAYLDVNRDGESTHDQDFIEGFSRAYVAFSGHSFPHILVPLMKDNNVMINPDRPMVIYESMTFEFDKLDAKNPSLELINSNLEVNGKRGSVRMEFAVMDNGLKVGSGFKSMVLSGLREYDQAKVDSLIELYESSKTAYAA
ncbi:MAG: hypothetical protein ISEC1_P1063 [Thiomicrorhabdus sp.]|nr:MAG: hypothetical protein ISEC1_P1063 [Thiomicrorhabdus sp.]